MAQRKQLVRVSGQVQKQQEEQQQEPGLNEHLRLP